MTLDDRTLTRRFFTAITVAPAITLALAAPASAGNGISDPLDIPLAEKGSYEEDGHLFLVTPGYAIPSYLPEPDDEHERMFYCPSTEALRDALKNRVGPPDTPGEDSKHRDCIGVPGWEWHDGYDYLEDSQKPIPQGTHTGKELGDPFAAYTTNTSNVLGNKDYTVYLVYRMRLDDGSIGYLVLSPKDVNTTIEIRERLHNRRWLEG